jgi:DNA-binding Xre family transcriptional regulator
MFPIFCIIFYKINRKIEQVMDVFLMDGIGKPRSKFGRWLDERGISQKWVSEQSGLNKNTVSKLASNDELPNGKTMKVVISTLKKIDPNIEVSDIWNM